MQKTCSGYSSKVHLQFFDAVSWATGGAIGSIKPVTIIRKDFLDEADRHTTIKWPFFHYNLDKLAIKRLNLSGFE